ncbi:MAG: formate/nitrite transporter family protein [Nitriliruptor sp.]|uniref:formate/nitrite transporter family protein n=1 Tax=Nitriliruptor sp. TaxID=2448056 RepID=UPI00349FF937
MTDPSEEVPRRPTMQYLAAPAVLEEMARFGRGRVGELTSGRALVLAVLGGGFITVGALFSLLVGSGVDAEGPKRLLEGFGFSAGFFFVVLSEAVLFTEANVVLPTTLLEDRHQWLRVVRFWAIAWVGNLAGVWLAAQLIATAQMYSPETLAALGEVIERKLAYRELGGAGAWWQLVLSGVLANWLVGMAAFFAFMGRTIIGKYIPVFLAVTAFVAAGFQHSPANMGYFALHLAHGGGPGWPTALGWNIVPAGIGNVIGAAVLVAVPFWFVHHPHREAARRGPTDR